MSGYNISLDRTKKDPLNIILDNVREKSNVLEFGCANGRMTRYMTETLGCTVDVVEYDQELFDIAIQYANDGICGDITDYEWCRKFADRKYDYIIFADVLEHLRNPLEVIVQCKNFLKDDGIVWTSVPNIAHNDIILKLLEGEFEYRETGLLDHTHIHFFTPKTAEKMFEEAGYFVAYRDAIYVQTFCSEQFQSDKPEWKSYCDEFLKRADGDAYQGVYALSLHPEATLGVKDYKYWDEQKSKYERRVYFDCGEGYKQGEITYASCAEQKLYIEAQLPENTRMVWISPAFRRRFIIKNLKIEVDDQEVSYCNIRAERHGEDYYFKTLESYIFVSAVKGGKKIVVTGEIILDVPFEKQEIQDQIEQIRAEQIQVTKKIEADLRNALSEKEKETQELLQRLDESKKCIDEYIEREKELTQTIEDKHRDIVYLDGERQRLSCMISKIEKTWLWRIRTFLARIVKKCIRFLFGALCCFLCLKPVSVVVKWVYAKLNNRLPGLARKFHALRNRVRAHCNPQKQDVQQCEETVQSAEEIKAAEEQSMRDAEKAAEEQAAREAAEALRQWEEQQWQEEITLDEEYHPLISIIVPNYNHAPYLEERLESIYNQTYDNYEVILLDDCSKDNSREILTRYAEKYPEKTKVAFNETNAGKVFLQWNKGMSLAKGEYIWIAESDDYSEPNFLEKMIQCFRYNSVMLVFARSVFMQEGKQIWSTEEYLSDVKTMRWDKPFTMTAANAVKLGFGYKNIIPNVSSAVFKNIGQVPDDVIRVCSNMNLSSDWIFYLAVIKGGCLAYTNETTNFYRIHQESTSLRVQNTMQYYDEYEMVSRYVAENYKVDEELFQNVLKYLLWHYKATQHVTDAEIVKEHYRIEMLKEVQTHRKPNIAMACFSLQSGGGETYPLYLANELHRQGNNVTLIDFNRERYEEQCRKLLDVSVPLVRMRDVGELVRTLEKLGIDVIHSHHASVDEIIGKLFEGSSYGCEHVITLHGMYETIEDIYLEHLFDVTGKSCGKFFYIADKNLIPFERFEMLDKVNLEKIDNGLPIIPVSAVPRAELGIEEEALVLCIVSRGIPEKGWKEGIEAVKKAREMTTRPIHLLIVGDGDIREELEKDSPDYIHFMGVRNNVRDFFAASDVGFLPTRFSGESYPLVVIEAMMCGKPIIATDIAEVKHQLTDEDGELAGELVNLHDGFLQIDEIADAILKLAEDREYYATLQKRTVSAIKKFDIANIANKYLEAYKEVIGLQS